MCYNKSMKKTAAFAVLVAGSFAVSVFLGSVAYAQHGTGLKIQPAIVEQSVDPGQVLNLSVQVTNLDPGTKTYYLATQDITSLTPSGQPILATSSQPGAYGLSSWITLSQKSVTLKSGETKTANYQIAVPKNASPGGHFGGLFLTANPPSANGNGAVVGFLVGNIISLRISGAVVETAQIQDFSTDHNIYGSPNVVFTTNVANQGNVLVRPRGPISISNMWGKNVGTVIMNDVAEAIFPGSARSFQVSWSGDGLSFGRYEAVMSLAYGDQAQKTISSSVSFWILPLGIILPFLLGLIVLILAIMFFMKWYVRRKLNQLGVSPNRSTAGVASYEKMPFSRLTLLTVIIVIFIALFLAALFIIFG
jgi:hypothetical protein